MCLIIESQYTFTIVYRDIPEDVLNTYCWIHSTFTVAGEGGAYPGVKGAGTSPRRRAKYYQWVAFTLFLQVSGVICIIQAVMRGVILQLNIRYRLLTMELSGAGQWRKFYNSCY